MEDGTASQEQVACARIWRNWTCGEMSHKRGAAKTGQVRSCRGWRQTSGAKLREAVEETSGAKLRVEAVETSGAKLRDEAAETCEHASGIKLKDATAVASMSRLSILGLPRQAGETLSRGRVSHDNVTAKVCWCLDWRAALQEISFCTGVGVRTNDGERALAQATLAGQDLGDAMLATRDIEGTWLCRTSSRIASSASCCVRPSSD